MRTMRHFLRWLVGLDSAESQTNERERLCLAAHALGKAKIVEVGVFEGLTTTYLRRSMAPNGELLCVDPYPVGRLGFSTHKVIAKNTIEKIRKGRVRWIRATGADAGRDYSVDQEGPVDFVFIDGDHSYQGLRGDWHSWSPHVSVGGVIALHDSRSSDQRNIDDVGSVIFTHEVILRDPRFRQVDVVDTLTVLERID